jgi:hypothetical protein
MCAHRLPNNKYIGKERIDEGIECGKKYTSFKTLINVLKQIFKMINVQTARYEIGTFGSHLGEHIGVIPYRAL